MRRGHDYRIEARLALQRSYGLDCTEQQADAIETALRANETEWAARRMIARKMDNARKSIESTLAKWGSPQIDVADIDPGAVVEHHDESPIERLGRISSP